MSAGAGRQVVAPCAACRQPMPHERIEPVSRGMDYYRCQICGTVFHTPKQPEPRP